jgi:hypothetical protein
MAVISLGGRGSDRRLQQLMMMHQLMQSTPGIGPGETAMERFAKEQEEERLRQREEARRERATTSEIAAREAQVQRGVEAGERGAKRYELEKWEAGERATRAWEAGARGERETAERELTGGLTREKLGAETETERIRAKAEAEKLEATKDWRVREQEEALRRNATNVYNMGIAQARAGNTQMLQKDNADRVEDAGKALFGPTYRIDRDAQGNWKPGKEVAAGVLDEHGVPTGQYELNLAKAAEPKTNFESYVRMYQDAKTKGDVDGMKLADDMIYHEIAPTVNAVQANLLKDLPADKKLEMIQSWRKSGAPQLKMPSPKAQADLQDRTDLLAKMTDLDREFKRLQKAGKFPTGIMATTWNDALNYIGREDPEVRTFHAAATDVALLYRLKVVGQQVNTKEMDQAQKAVPGLDDDLQAFPQKLKQMHRNTHRRIEDDLGWMQAFGTDVRLAGFTPRSPDEQLRRYGAPDLTTEAGQQLHSGATAKAGIENIAGAARRTGQQIGGPGEFRGAPDRAKVATAVSEVMSMPTEKVTDYLTSLNDPALVQQVLDQVRGGQSAE